MYGHLICFPLSIIVVVLQFAALCAFDSALLEKCVVQKYPGYEFDLDPTLLLELTAQPQLP